MTTSLIPILSYILISTFTPGPSNISSASLAVLHGYKNTLKYQAGLAAGVFLLMFLSGLLSTTVVRIFPSFEPIMRLWDPKSQLYLHRKRQQIIRVCTRLHIADIKPKTFCLRIHLIFCIPCHHDQKHNYPTSGGDLPRGGRVLRHVHLGFIWDGH